MSEAMEKTCYYYQKPVLRILDGYYLQESMS